MLSLKVNSYYGTVLGLSVRIAGVIKVQEKDKFYDVFLGFILDNVGSEDSIMIRYKPDGTPLDDKNSGFILFKEYDIQFPVSDSDKSFFIIPKLDEDRRVIGISRLTFYESFASASRYAGEDEIVVEVKISVVSHLPQEIRESIRLHSEM